MIPIDNFSKYEEKMIIKNGLVALSGKDDFEKLDLKIEDQKIIKIAKDINNDPEIVNAANCLIFPGAIDPHVHFFDPGYTYNESFFSGTSAAAAGGITTIIDMPCTSIPAVTNLRNLKNKLAEIKNSAVIDFGFFGGISKQTFSDSLTLNMTEISDYVLGFKVYTISGMESFESLSYNEIKRVLQIAKSLHRPVLVHSEDKELIEENTFINIKKGNSPLHYYLSRPEEAEISSAAKLAKIIKEIGGDLHIVHVGSAEVLEVIENSGITCETAPHYLEFDLKDFERTGSIIKITPPLKQPYNKLKLWDLIRQKKMPRY